MGVSIGAGTVARLLADSTGRWAEEADAIHQAGLASGPCVATDQTATRVDGCQALLVHRLAPGRFFRRLRPRVQPTANNQAHARRLRAEPELLVEAHGVVREEVDVLPRQLFQQETHYRTPDPAMAVG